MSSRLNSRTLLRRLLISCMRSRAGMLRVVRGPLKGMYFEESYVREGLSVLLGTYERQMADVLARSLNREDVFYDIGANAGYFSLLASTIVSRGCVFAFEPSPEVYGTLRKHVEKNGLDKRVTTLNMAISDRSGCVPFVMPKSGSKAQGLLKCALKGQSTEPGYEVSVQCTTLDEYVYEKGNQPPTFIKIDVEGAEACVLRGGNRVLNDARPRLAVEVHGIDCAEQVWREVDRVRYRWFPLDTDSPIPLDDVSTVKSGFLGSRWKTRQFLLRPV